MAVRLFTEQCLQCKLHLSVTMMVPRMGFLRRNNTVVRPNRENSSSVEVFIVPQYTPAPILKASRNCIGRRINGNLQKYGGRIPRDEVLTSRLTPKMMSEASATLNARALKARSISPCKLHPAGECPPNKEPR